MKKIFIPFFIFSIFTLAFLVHRSEFLLKVSPQNVPARLPSNAISFSCNDILLKLFTNKTHLFQDYVHYASQRLLQLSYSTRLLYLEFLGHHHFQSNKLNYKYADLLNYSLKKKIVTEDDVIQTINSLKVKGFSQVYFQDHTVYPFLLDSLANDEEVSIFILSVKEELRNYLQDQLEKIELSRRELAGLEVVGKEMVVIDDVSRAIAYIKYSRTFDELEQVKCLEDTKYLFSKNTISKYLVSFEKNQKKVEKFISSEKSKKTNELMSVQNYSEIEAKKVAIEWSEKQGKVYQELLYSCQAKGGNAQRTVTNKKFFQTVLGLEFVIGSGTYLFFHNEDEKNSEWYKKFAAETFLRIVGAAARSGITTMSSGEWYKKVIQDYTFSGTSDIMPSLGYSVAFGLTKKDLEKKLEQLFDDPDFQVKLKELEIIMQEDGLLDNNKVRIKNENGDYITFADLKNNEEAREVLTQALAKEMYKEKQGEWIQSGDVGLDRYIYHRLWGIQSSVRSILVNLLIYKILCMGDIDPQQAYFMAVGIYTTNKIISEPIYQSLRKKAINQ